MISSMKIITLTIALFLVSGFCHSHMNEPLIELKIESVDDDGNLTFILENKGDSSFRVHKYELCDEYGFSNHDTFRIMSLLSESIIPYTYIIVDMPYFYHDSNYIVISPKGKLSNVCAISELYDIDRGTPYSVRFVSTFPAYRDEQIEITVESNTYEFVLNKR